MDGVQLIHLTAPGTKRHVTVAAMQTIQKVVYRLQNYIIFELCEAYMYAVTRKHYTCIRISFRASDYSGPPSILLDVGLLPRSTNIPPRIVLFRLFSISPSSSS